jgi:repressor LexA
LYTFNRETYWGYWDMHKLTDKQRRILELIADAIERDGYPPTYQQLCDVLGFSSKNGVKKHIDALVAKGYMEKDSSARGMRIIDPEFKPHGNEESNVPLIGHVAAGFPILADENVERYVPVPRHLIKSEGRYYALRVRGDSMINAGIFDGDLVIVKANNVANPNDIVVALIGDEVTVKRFIVDGGMNYLKAENPAYHDIYPQEEWSIQGKVVGLIRENFN